MSEVCIAQICVAYRLYSDRADPVLSNTQFIIVLNNKSNDTFQKDPKSASILIVEDEKLIGWSVGRLLQKAGFDVSIVETGEQAIEKLHSQKFCLVLTDLHVPLCGGLRVAEKVKRNDDSTPVVMMSSSLLSSDEKGSYKNVVDVFIEKPVDFEDFLALVKNLIKRFGCGK